MDARRRGEVLREKERLDARANLSAAELLKEQLKENAALSANGTTPNMWEGDARRLGTSEEDRIATAKKNIAAIAASKLWVDAHAPKLFTELLSPEQTNREVLHWLKAWDGIVFKRAPPKPGDDRLEAEGRRRRKRRRRERRRRERRWKRRRERRRRRRVPGRRGVQEGVQEEGRGRV